MNKEHTLVQQESQSSFEVGRADRRLKVYFWKASELHQKLEELKEVIEKNKEFIDEMNTKG